MTISRQTFIAVYDKSQGFWLLLWMALLHGRQ
jgi:hypothetical protein